MEHLYDHYNLTWHIKGQSDRAAIPLGNGDLAASFWVTEEGIHFYLAKSDAYTETDRNVKLGKVSVLMEPNPFAGEGPFKQHMNIYDGCVHVEASCDRVKAELRIFVDKMSNVVYIQGDVDKPVLVSVKYDNWRTVKMSPEEDQFGVSAENTDVIAAVDQGLLFYHQNGKTCVQEAAELEGLSEHIDDIPDSITNRIFGGIIQINGGNAQDSVIRTSETKSFTAKIAVLSEQPTILSDWTARVIRLGSDAVTTDVAFNRTKQWWNDYWNQSYIFVEGDKSVTPIYTDSMHEYAQEPIEKDDSVSAVTRAYTHTKYMFACCSTGEFPIPFNGALFNLMPGAGKHLNVNELSESLTKQPETEPNELINPDERPWGHCNLWQNLRLPYYSMLARKEYDGIRVLFRHFKRFWSLDRHKQRIYYNGEGQYNNELTTSFGLMPAGAYGYDRTGLAPGYAVTRYSAAVDLSPGLELTTLMLDYYAYTQDKEFMRMDLLPYAKDLLRGIETRFTERSDGKMVLSPLHCVETFHDTTNPITVVAGLHAVTDRLLSITDMDEDLYRYFQAYKSIIPEIPQENPEKPHYAPAAVYGKRENVEPVWITPVFPFRLATQHNGNYQLAMNSYEFCQKEKEDVYQSFTLGNPPIYSCYSGWQFTGMAAALLGMSDDAAEVVSNNSALSNPGHKYPAMWGPIYDGVPDVDHGANILTTLQLMLLQFNGETIYLLPAWKKEWDVTFKLYAPMDTVICCVYKGGKVESLSVVPEHRKKDVVICIGE